MQTMCLYRNRIKLGTKSNNLSRKSPNFWKLSSTENRVRKKSQEVRKYSKWNDSENTMLWTKCGPPLQVSYVEILPPNVMILEGVAFGR